MTLPGDLNCQSDHVRIGIIDTVNTDFPMIDEARTLLDYGLRAVEQVPESCRLFLVPFRQS